jgi:hypothetical protein
MMLCSTHHASVLGWQPDSHLSYTPPRSNGSACTSEEFRLYLTGHEGVDCCAEAVLQHSASTALASTRKPKRPINPAISDDYVTNQHILSLQPSVCHSESLRATSCTVQEVSKVLTAASSFRHFNTETDVYCLESQQHSHTMAVT